MNQLADSMSKTQIATTGQRANIFKHLNGFPEKYIRDVGTFMKLVKDLDMGRSFVPDITYLRHKFLNGPIAMIDLRFRERINDNNLLRITNNMTKGAALEVIELAKQFCALFTKDSESRDKYIDGYIDTLMSELCTRDKLYDTHGIRCFSFDESPIIFQVFIAECFQYLISRCHQSNKLPDLVLFCSMILDNMNWIRDDDEDDWFHSTWTDTMTEFYKENKEFTCYYNINNVDKYTSITGEIADYLPKEREVHENGFPDDILATLKEAHSALTELPDVFVHS
jgi:hypothetical protein